MSTRLPRRIIREVQERLTERGGGAASIAEIHGLGGGCINPAARIVLETGDAFFLKWNEELPSELFLLEAEGLEALRQTAAIRVPTVVGVGDGWLLLEFIDSTPFGPGFGKRLGRALAELHMPGSERYGWTKPNYLGPLPQENLWVEDWAAFWRDHRIHPQLRRAHDGRRISMSEKREIEALLVRVDALLTDGPAGASLLHGDLWSGNVLSSRDGDPVLVDPAVYYGDHEVDLAMAELFGGVPHDFLSAYRERLPLRSGYVEVRRDLYQLYPLLVHVNLFGGGYRAQAMDHVRRLLGKA